MRTSTRSLAADKFTESDSPNLNVKHTDPSVVYKQDSISHSALAAGLDISARQLSAPGLRASLLQHVQRKYGNLASQQLVQRALQRQGSPSFGSFAPELDAMPSGGGQPLEASARAPLERHFQTDLDQIRIHTGQEAAESAASLDALAYTRGRDIYFAPGMYAPSSSSGQRLLAHEVAHVVQQSSGKEPTTATKSAHGAKIAAPDGILEGEADRHAEQFMSGQPETEVTEQERKKRSSSPIIQRTPVWVQRQQAGQQSTTSLDATAQSIIRGAANTTRDPGVRAVEAVWRIIQEYYSSQATNVNVVTYDNKEAKTGLATRPHPASNPTSGRIFVGDDFLNGVQNAKNFAHHVLQVGHELEHINQFRDPALGPSAAKKDEREFLAFYHEALATEVPHTGRFQHSTRIEVIDQALGYYNCLASSSDPDKQNAAQKYATYQQQLLARRTSEITEMTNKGYTNVPTTAAPADCRRQP